jgi:hypothetical protein
MLYYCPISISKLKKLKKNYPWIRPVSCYRCNNQLWGHGFVLRFFNQMSEALFIKRWRCPKCKITLTCRPNLYWRRYQETISNIYDTLIFKIIHYKWPPGVSRQRGGHWLKKFISKAKINLLMKSTLIETIYFFKNKNLAIFD